MPDDTAKARVPARPGVALRKIRMERGWTLSEVARRTGLSVSALSKVENNKLSVSYDKLARLSEGLEVDIARFFAGGADATAVGDKPLAALSGRRSLTPRGTGEAIDTEHYRHLYPASELLNKRFIPVIVDVRKRSLADFGEMFRHPGEEYVYVLEGAVEVHSEFYTPTRLETGDSMYFDSGMAHAYVAVGDAPCRILSINSATGAYGHGAVEDSEGDPRGDVIPLRRAGRRPGDGS
jgi:transcriptional regulator with XRE-family HTH domain